MAEVRRRHAIRPKLNDSEISLTEVIIPATIMIRNLPLDISRDVLELYFSNRRRSDGGQVVDVTHDHEQQHALVTFSDCEGYYRQKKQFDFQLVFFFFPYIMNFFLFRCTSSY